MWPFLQRARFAAIVAFAFFLAGRAAAETPPGTLNLLELVRQKDQAKPIERTRLAPEWVGTIRGGDEENLHLRLTHIGRNTKGEGKEATSIIWAARMRENGSFVGCDYAEFRSKLPTTEELKAAKKLSRLFELLGPRQDAFQAIADGWGFRERYHWIEDWNYFTTGDKGTLRWLVVCASVSAKGDGRSRPALAQIDELKIREGILRPAIPGFAPEEDLFKNADQLHEIEERAQQAKRAKIPQPLRDLVAADEAPDDSDLKIFAAAISKVRKNPDPEIFKQMAAYDDSGMGFSYLARVLLDEITGADPWTAENKAKAIQHAVDSLAVAPEGKLQGMSETLLEAIGGGKLDIKEPEMDLEVKLFEGSKSMSYSRWGVNEENRPKAVKALQDWFRAKLK